MKTQNALLIGFLMISSSALYAQKPKDLKGPAAKNYKPWKNTEAQVTPIVTTQEDKLMGPAAKNAKPSKVQNASGTQIVTGSARTKLKGPAAKNYKAWKN